MGNESSSKSSSSSSSNSNSSTDDKDSVRDRLNSGDFQKISPPSSPSINMKKDELSYSGILVEKPDSSEVSAATIASSTAGAPSFAADLSTNKSKSSKSKAAAAAAAATQEPRRIIKATPPVKNNDDDNRNDGDSSDSSSSAAVQHTHHATVMSSPKGANAANELLEESIEKNASKNKRLERVTSKQKNDRGKLLQEKRMNSKKQSQKEKVQANPFSRFLSAFSVDANPKHKRKESIDKYPNSGNGNGDGDPNKRLKFGFNDTSSAGTAGGGNDNDNDTTAKIEKKVDDDVVVLDDEGGDGEGEEDRESILSSLFSSWVAVASVATVAVMVFAIVRGSKNK